MKYNISVTHTLCVRFIFAAVVVAANDLNLDKWTRNAAANFYQVAGTEHLKSSITLIYNVAWSTKSHSKH